jgi:uncharacterized membrane protein
MIEIGGQITIGGLITIGPVPVFVETNFFVTQSGADNLVTQNDDPFIEE